MRPPVHPDDSVVAPEDAFERVRDQFVCDGIQALGDAHVRSGAAHEVDRGVRLRHSFRKSEDRGIPVRRLLSSGVVDRQSQCSRRARRPARDAADPRGRARPIHLRCRPLLRESRSTAQHEQHDQGLDEHHRVVSPRGPRMPTATDITLSRVILRCQICFARSMQAVSNSV